MSSALSDRVRRLLDEAVAGDVIPGAVAVVAEPRSVTDVVAAGRLRIDGGEAVDAKTMFRFASMTKAVTSVAALQLIEQGSISLETEVAEILPEYGDLRVLAGFDGERPVLREPSRSATVRHLMTHTAGHGYPWGNADLLRYIESSGTPSPLWGELASLRAPLMVDPGERWEYGTSHDWLGLVVEQVSGRPLDAFITKNVLAPLGMSETTFTPSAEQLGRLMPVHRRTQSGGLELNGFEFPPQPEFWPGGHGLYGTAPDYARFMAAILAGGEIDGTRVLSQESIELALSDQLQGAVLPGAFTSTMPELVSDIPEMPIAQGWGLGFHLVLEDLPDMRAAATADWSGLFNSYFWIDRKSGVAAALFTQVLPFFDERVLQPLQDFERAVYLER